ncbi:MAG TPA: surface-adhesin E family protein [Ramlibacter sp.]|nr:surface-adhesin E family protein [Ramlibacter sp.]
MSCLRAISVALLLAPLAGQAQWVSYAQTESGSFFLDPGSVRQEGPRTLVWRLFELQQRRGDGVQSGKALVELDCAAGSYRYLRTFHYGGSMGHGQYIGSAAVHPPEPISPGSVVDELARRVCPRPAPSKPAR